MGFYLRGPSRIIEPSVLPLPQQFLINREAKDLMNSDESITKILQNFPELRDSFDLTFSDQYGPNMSYQEYQQAVFDFGQKEVAEYPYHYGSYEIFQVNREE